MAHRADGLNDIFDNNVTIRGSTTLTTGTIQKLPVADYEIVPKIYVDAQDLAIQSSYLSGHPHQSVANSATPVFNSVRLTNLDPLNIPYHFDDSTGLVNSPLYVDGADVVTLTGSVGINVLTPQAKIESLSTATPQLRLTYEDGLKYTDFTTDVSGNMVINPTGDRVTIQSNIHGVDIYSTNIYAGYGGSPGYPGTLNLHDGSSGYFQATYNSWGGALTVNGALTSISTIAGTYLEINKQFASAQAARIIMGNTASGAVSAYLESQVKNIASGSVTHISRFGAQDNNAGTIRTLFVCAGPADASGANTQGYFDLVTENGTKYMFRCDSLDANTGATFKLYDRVSQQINCLIHTSGSTYFRGGNIGIGTTTPGERLHLTNGTLRVDDSVAPPAVASAGTIVNRYGGATTFLGNPNSWLKINVSGSYYRIPLYS